MATAKCSDTMTTVAARVARCNWYRVYCVAELEWEANFGACLGWAYCTTAHVRSEVPQGATDGATVVTRHHHHWRINGDASESPFSTPSRKLFG